MSGTATRYGGEEIIAGERFFITAPKVYFSGKRGILYVHGVEDGQYGNGNRAYREFVERYSLIEQIARAGHTILSTDAGGNGTWGNNTVLNALTLAKTYLSSLPRVMPGKIVVLTNSMGAVNALAWAAAHIVDVQAMVGMIPICDLTDEHANNRGGFTSAINTAYGGAYSEATYGALHNPQTLAIGGSLSSFPIRLYPGTTDIVAPQAQTTAFAAAAGSNVIITPLAGGHAESTIGLIDYAELIVWIETQG